MEAMFDNRLSLTDPVHVNGIHEQRGSRLGPGINVFASCEGFVDSGEDETSALE